MEKSHSKRHELTFGGSFSMVIVLIVPQKWNYMHYWFKLVSPQCLYTWIWKFKWLRYCTIGSYYWTHWWNIFDLIRTVRGQQECNSSILGREHKYVYIYKRIYVYVYIHTNLQPQIDTCMYIYIYVHIHKHIYTQIYISYIHICIHIYIYTYM